MMKAQVSDVEVEAALDIAIVNRPVHAMVTKRKPVRARMHSVKPTTYGTRGKRGRPVQGTICVVSGG